MTPKQYAAAARRCEKAGDAEGAAAFKRLALHTTTEIGLTGVEAHLVKRVKELGGETRKVQWIGRRGAPDRLVLIPARQVPSGLAMLPGWAFWAELKRPRGGKLSKQQCIEIATLQASGHEAYVLWSIEDIDNLLGPF